MSKYGDSNKYGASNNTFSSSSKAKYGYQNENKNPFTNAMKNDKYLCSTNKYEKSNQCLLDSKSSKSYGGYPSSSSKYDSDVKKSESKIPYERFDYSKYSSQPNKWGCERSSDSNVKYERMDGEKNSSKFSNWFKRK